jgi:hypothetical protein
LPAESNYGGAAASGIQRGVPKFDDGRVARENGTHDLPLHSDTAPVDNSQGREAEPFSLGQVFLDNRFHVAWRYGMQVEDVCYGDTKRFRVVHGERALKKQKPGQLLRTGRALLAQRA